MSLTPKNWKSFQHYGDRRPSWIKLHRTLLDDYDYMCLPVASRALAPCLWLLASEYQDGKITLSMEGLCFRLRVKEQDLKSALIPLVQKGFFISDSTALAECLPREEKRTSIEEETSSCAVANATRTDPAGFEVFWRQYPKREGANPKAPARKAFLAALKAGAEPGAIILGAIRYKQDPATKVGTPYVTMAVTWLNQKRWEDYGPPEIPPNGKANDDMAGKYHAAAGSPQIEAWDKHRIATEGKIYPRDKSGGWWFETEWPPQNVFNISAAEYEKA